MNSQETSPLIAAIIDEICPPGEDARNAMEVNLAHCLQGSDDGWGELREILLRFTSATGQDGVMGIEPPKKCTLILCADHGVASLGVSAYPGETTAQMAQNYLISQGAAANVFADFAGSDLSVVDMGMATMAENIPGLLNRRIAAGTQNMTEGAAMTREQAIRAVEIGIELAEACIEKGYNVILPGEMGIGNTTASAAICAAICDAPAKMVTGRGTNISDERLQKKIAAVEKALAVNNPDPTDGLDVLAKVGGFELGGIAGIILGAAASRVTVILDGFNTGAAALIAATLAPGCVDYLIPSQLSAEPGAKIALDQLGLTPCLNLRLRLGEACGSSLVADFLDGAVAVYNAMDEYCTEIETTPNDIVEDTEEDLDNVTRERMPSDIPIVTDRTFDFYLSTMPEIDRAAMRRAGERLLNLAKPPYSLGYLEEIAKELAGIAGEERPLSAANFTLLCFAGKKNALWQEKMIGSLAEYAQGDVVMASLRFNLPPTAAFDFGRGLAEDISFNTPLIGVALCEMKPQDPPGTLSQRLRKALLNKDNTLRYPPDEFLAHIPKDLKIVVSAVMGAIIAATRNSSLVILDSEATDIIARYTEALNPSCRPYILHVAPSLIQMNITVGGGILSILGRRLVDAALAIINDMKTFDETGVATSLDVARGGEVYGR
ncbi:MAG: nicotinate-nucleotide--dimethylbenzimidazole phosphoribosyltransferase [Selenomonadaceae bacterium]|nr:nicotinate-nucleotide--dimethylbenzimidazole phosphoribosyltransferase [Selenomonadaceae bacterium]